MSVRKDPITIAAFRLCLLTVCKYLRKIKEIVASVPTYMVPKSWS